MRRRNKARLVAIAGGKETTPTHDPATEVALRVWRLREALRKHMAGEMLRGRQTVKIVAPDGTVPGEEDRKRELEAIALCENGLRFALVQELVAELPEPPKEEPTPEPSV